MLFIPLKNVKNISKYFFENIPIKCAHAVPNLNRKFIEQQSIENKEIKIKRVILNNIILNNTK